MRLLKSKWATLHHPEEEHTIIPEINSLNKVEHTDMIISESVITSGLRQPTVESGDLIGSC